MREQLVRWTVAAAMAVGLVIGTVAPAGAADITVEGAYSGPGSFVNDECAVPNQPPGTVPIGTAFQATGELSPLGASDLDMIFCVDPLVGSERAFGPLTISTDDGTLTGDLAGSFRFDSIGGPFVYEMTATLTGGTGDFEGATGTLLLEGTFSIGPFVVDGRVSGTVTVPANTPTSKDDCKDGGWRDLEDENGEPFTSQGDCIRWVKEHLDPDA